MNTWIRQVHRWLAIAFTLAFVITSVAIAAGTTAEWLYYLPLLPLFVLFFTGLYMLVLPWTRKGRRAQSARV